MSDSNTTNVINPSTFIPLGIPGLEKAHVWISIPFCSMYVIAVWGNFTILFIVKMEPSLHGPMYYFLCMLAVTDLVLCTCTLSKTLSILWFNSREVDFNALLTQMFFIHSFLDMAMAFDCYVAICDPLRHSIILRNPVVAKISLAVVMRGCMLVMPCPLLARQLPYCRTNIIPHSCCEHIAMVNLACADIHINSYYGLVNGNLGDWSGCVFYRCVLYPDPQAIFSLPTKVARLKTFQTCASHLCAFLAFYISGLFSVLMYQIGQNMDLHLNVLFTNVCLLVPPMQNPIIFYVRTKQIRDRLLQLFTHKGT
ncbi:unnamed protein product [Natator depressus]